MHHRPFRLTLAALLAGASLTASAHELYSDAERHLNANVEAVFGAFHSERSYAIARDQPGSTSWREGYIKYGLSADQALGSVGSLYGAFAMLSSATWGDGDAAGFSDGSERTSKIEDAYVGWKSGNLVPILGEDGIDLSFGKQMVAVGDGFLLQGDSLNVGHGLADGQFNRGGAYYLAARKSFDKTAVLRLGGSSGWRGDLMWLQSDNRAQANTELHVATLEHVADAGTVGLTYIGTTHVDEQYASPLQLERDGMKTYSLRGQGNAGVENLFLSGEYAKQDKPHTATEDAWYLEAGWTFADLPWQPNLSYRYSRFSEQYDTLFYGLGRGLGTWFQGEVAGNYAGPFNSNARVQKLGLTVSPTPTLNLGVMGFHFDTIDRSLGNVDGRELDIYAEWTLNDHLMIVPLVGLYQPDRSVEQGGTQLGNNHDNLYGQVVFVSTF
ncbi:hypothetical protein PZ739_16435 [Pseudomonas kermanshahensis]|uniref:hypothetical protein n=1 Tax=Pseudomonas kermanshahensis TaxID=2745482 RepID=UPI0023DA9F23|nr:hypothetical protein [Pseudomonas kermanshahensis]WEL53429.1 hypothetical protein PZ739_16435 [Pseudomonas kermanshahensis]